MRTHYAGDTRPHACETCGKMYGIPHPFVLNALRLGCFQATPPPSHWLVIISSYLIIFLSRFAFKHNLLQHVRTHSRDVRYTCDVCNFETFSKSYSREHKKLHGEKRYECVPCGKKFAIIASLNVCMPYTRIEDFVLVIYWEVKKSVHFSYAISDSSTYAFERKAIQMHNLRSSNQKIILFAYTYVKSA